MRVESVGKNAQQLQAGVVLLAHAEDRLQHVGHAVEAELFEFDRARHIVGREQGRAHAQPECGRRVDHDGVETACQHRHVPAERREHHVRLAAFEVGEGFCAWKEHQRFVRVARHRDRRGLKQRGSLDAAVVLCEHLAGVALAVEVEHGDALALLVHQPVCKEDRQRAFADAALLVTENHGAHGLSSIRTYRFCIQGANTDSKESVQALLTGLASFSCEVVHDGCRTVVDGAASEFFCSLQGPLSAGPVGVAVHAGTAEYLHTPPRYRKL